MSDHKYAKTLPEAEAAAVNAGLDLEDANSASQTVFSGIPDAINLGLLNETDVDVAVSRLMKVRMLTGEFDPADGNRYTNISMDHIRSSSNLALAKLAATKSLVLLKNDPLTHGPLLKALPLRQNVTMKLAVPEACV
eukprot:gene57960-biopygen14028